MFKSAQLDDLDPDFKIDQPMDYIECKGTIRVFERCVAMLCIEACDELDKLSSERYEKILPTYNKILKDCKDSVLLNSLTNQLVEDSRTLLNNVISSLRDKIENARIETLDKLKLEDSQISDDSANHILDNIIKVHTSMVSSRRNDLILKFTEMCNNAYDESIKSKKTEKDKCIIN
jgi:hypothetical protein